MRHEWIDAAMNSDLPTAAKLICYVIYRHADKSGRCFPSVARMARLTTTHRTTVMRHIDALEGEWITTIRVEGCPNEYQIRMPDQSHHATGSTVRPVAPCDTTSRTVQQNQSHHATLTPPLTPPLTPNGAHSDLVKRLFDVGVSILTEAGCPDRNARSLIGRLRKTRGDGGALDAIRQAADKSDPQSWIAACGNPNRKTKGDIRREQFDAANQRWLEETLRRIDEAERAAERSAQSRRGH